MSGSLPVFGHLLSFFKDPTQTVARGTEELGPLFWVETGFGRRRDLVYSSPAAIELLRRKELESGHFYEELPLFFGRSLLVVDGDEHRHMRAAMNKPFAPRGLDRAGVGHIAATATRARVAAWVGRSQVEILAETQELALQIIFGIIGVEAEELSLWRKQFRTFMLSAVHLPLEFPGSPKWWAQRARRWLDEHLLALIEAVRNDPEAHGLLAELVRGRDEAGQQLSEPELLDNLRLLVIGGHETSASTMAWMMIYLAESPERWARLCAEADALDSIPATASELGRCPYAQALFREAVRMHPPIYADTRRTRAELELEGHRIPAGTVIHIPLGYISRTPSIFARPDEFDPQRWLGDRRLSPVETAQFGGGPHFCLGYHLALLEGTQLAITAAKQLSEAGLRPAIDRVPAPIYLPLAHPPARTRIRLVPA